MKIADLSYRYKTPLSISVVILVTALIVSAILVWGAWRDAQRELTQNAVHLGRLLSHTLRDPLLRDQVWSSYELLRAALGDGDEQRLGVVVDRHGLVYVSNDPQNVHIYTPAEHLPRLPWRSLADPPAGGRIAEDGQAIFVAFPIVAEDGTHLGTLILAHAKALVAPRFYTLSRQVLLAIAAALALILPLGWYWGRRMAEPLAHLADCMAEVGKRPWHEFHCALGEGSDEIGLLSTRFRQMLRELEEKAALEKEMLATQRLAAIGRLTAGIAHEINNPLGGMLNAVSTWRKHGTPDEVGLRTLSLLERGLTQIRETVAALLVEAKVESHALSPADLEDVRTLAQAEAGRRHARLDWHSTIDRPLPLPSTPVRQILLNLLLNAARAAGRGGRVEARIGVEDGLLRLRVSNDGAHIPEDKLEHLFEPFANASSDGHGLGLWITYQLVSQLEGSIRVQSRPGETRFEIDLPLERS